MPAIKEISLWLNVCHALCALRPEIGLIPDFSLVRFFPPHKLVQGKKTQNIKQKDMNMKTQSSTMKKTILKILEKRNQLEKFLNSMEFHLRIENPGYMPLVIERHGQHVTVTHYYNQNGDQIADPDLKMLIGADGDWYPVGLQLCTGHYSRARWTENGRELTNLRINQEVKSFSTMWARNLAAQGW